MITANADRPPSHLCDGLIDCQNGRRASIGNYSTGANISARWCTILCCQSSCESNRHTDGTHSITSTTCTGCNNGIHMCHHKLLRTFSRNAVFFSFLMNLYLSRENQPKQAGTLYSETKNSVDWLSCQYLHYYSSYHHLDGLPCPKIALFRFLWTKNWHI